MHFLYRDLDLIPFHREDTAFIISVAGGARAADHCAARGPQPGGIPAQRVKKHLGTRFVFFMTKVPKCRVIIDICPKLR